MTLILQKGFGRTPEEVGMLGTIIVESLGKGTICSLLPYLVATATIVSSDQGPGKLLCEADGERYMYAALMALKILCVCQGQHVPPRRHKGRSQVRKGMAYICNLAVDNAFRRRGIGQTLLQQAAKVCCLPSLSHSPDSTLQELWQNLSNEQGRSTCYA